MGKAIDIVFDGPPGPVPGRFVEVEFDGASIKFGEWEERADGFWVLKLDAEALARALVERFDSTEVSKALAFAAAWGTS